MNIKKLFYKGKFQFEKHKGLIFTLLSAGLEIAAVISMAKQAPKAEKVLIPANKKVQKIKEELKDTEAIANGQIIPAEHKKEMRKIQRKTILEVSKIYALPVIFTGASLAFMGGSYKTMKNKQIALGAAYVTLENAYKSYRDRVKEKLGSDVENAIFKDIHEENITKTVEDSKTGELKEISEIANKIHSGGPWEIEFNEASRIYTKNGRLNWEILMERQKQLNMDLAGKGYVFLYDVFKALEIPEGCIPKDLLLASKVIGWVYGSGNHVDFGISVEPGIAAGVGKDLHDNIETCAMLSFNPDGNILLNKNGDSFVNYVVD